MHVFGGSVVEIAEDGQVIELLVENEPEPDEPETPEEPKDDEPEDDPKKPDPNSPTPPNPPNKPGITAPQTGDETSLPWLVLILSGLGIVVVSILMVKVNAKNKEE